MPVPSTAGHLPSASRNCYSAANDLSQPNAVVSACVWVVATCGRRSSQPRVVRGAHVSENGRPRRVTQLAIRSQLRPLAYMRSHPSCRLSCGVSVTTSLGMGTDQYCPKPSSQARDQAPSVLGQADESCSAIGSN